MTSDPPWWLTMPPAELGARILPLFSTSSHEAELIAIQAIVAWCETGTYKKPRVASANLRHFFEDPDRRAVAEAIQVLEQARLLVRIVDNASYVGLTRLGQHALATNSVGKHLGVSGSSP